MVVTKLGPSYCDLVPSFVGSWVFAFQSACRRHWKDKDEKGRKGNEKYVSEKLPGRWGCECSFFLDIFDPIGWGRRVECAFRHHNDSHPTENHANGQRIRILVALEYYHIILLKFVEFAFIHSPHGARRLFSSHKL